MKASTEKGEVKQGWRRGEEAKTPRYIKKKNAAKYTRAFGLCTSVRTTATRRSASPTNRRSQLTNLLLDIAGAALLLRPGPHRYRGPRRMIWGLSRLTATSLFLKMEVFQRQGPFQDGPAGLIGS